jgi:hypothetical protein
LNQPFTASLVRGKIFSPLRRQLVLSPLAFGLAALPAAGTHAAPDAALLPWPGSLAAELSAALKSGRPLIVMASLDGCPYCKIVRENYLVPLRRETGQPAVQLDLGSSRAVTDFQGAARTHAQLLAGWRVRVAPSVMFFGPQGRELAERLVGASIPDFYGAYLEQRLLDARRALG